MNKRPSAVITDMDGSLLGPDHTIGEQDLRTIRTLKSMGIPVFVATGRHHSICRWYFDEIGTDYPAATANGAMLYDFATSTLLETATISKEVLRELAKFAADNGLVYYVHTDTHCLLNDTNPESESFKMDYGIFKHARQDEVGIMGDNYDLYSNTIVKFMLPDCTAEHYARFAETPVSKLVDAQYSWKNFLDINPLGTSKGIAAATLAQRYGFDLADTVAMGDNFNDTSMLSVVGYPVVTASGEPEVQRLARFITRASGDNPLTYAIESLFPGLLR